MAYKATFIWSYISLEGQNDRAHDDCVGLILTFGTLLLNQTEGAWKTGSRPFGNTAKSGVISAGGVTAVALSRTESFDMNAGPCPKD